MAKSIQDTPRMKIVPGPKTGAANANAGSPRRAASESAPRKAPTSAELDELERKLIERRPPAGPPLPAPDVPSTNSTQAPSSEPERK